MPFSEDQYEVLAELTRALFARYGRLDLAGHSDIAPARTFGFLKDLKMMNGLGLGFNGAVTLESRRIRHLQGLALYGWAFARAWWSRFATPVMHVRLDGEDKKGPTLALSLALGRREGNFVVAPEARLDDGLFDYVHTGAVSRFEVLRAQIPERLEKRSTRHGHVEQDEEVLLRLHVPAARRLLRRPKARLDVLLAHRTIAEAADRARRHQRLENGIRQIAVLHRPSNRGARFSLIASTAST